MRVATGRQGTGISLPGTGGGPRWRPVRVFSGKTHPKQYFFEFFVPFGCRKCAWRFHDRRIKPTFSADSLGILIPSPHGKKAHAKAYSTGDATPSSQAVTDEQSR